MTNLRIANKDGFKFGEQAYLIHNEYGLVCISYANHEQEALDNAVNEDLMDSFLMSSEDYAEYEAKGWDDSYILLGNASEAFWSEYMGITLASERERAA
jgi:hypothetical protein